MFASIFSAKKHADIVERIYSQEEVKLLIEKTKFLESKIEILESYIRKMTAGQVEEFRSLTPDSSPFMDDPYGIDALEMKFEKVRLYLEADSRSTGSPGLENSMRRSSISYKETNKYPKINEKKSSPFDSESDSS
uniref:Uncharacterized protein n=1 Tax=Rhabditophanes sp. KR3021 TaxID=114890 RepID=A0AC35TVD2_9BILA